MSAGNCSAKARSLAGSSLATAFNVARGRSEMRRRAPKASTSALASALVMPGIFSSSASVRPARPSISDFGALAICASPGNEAAILPSSCGLIFSRSASLGMSSAISRRSLALRFVTLLSSATIASLSTLSSGWLVTVVQSVPRLSPNGVVTHCTPSSIDTDVSSGRI